jgi:BMFP domain-containing protein YqiC
VEGGAANGRKSAREQELEKKVAALEAKLTKKGSIIAEISAEYVDLKKALGEP